MTHTVPASWGCLSFPFFFCPPPIPNTVGQQTWHDTLLGETRLINFLHWCRVVAPSCSLAESRNLILSEDPGLVPLIFHALFGPDHARRLRDQATPCSGSGYFKNAPLDTLCCKHMQMRRSQKTLKSHQGEARKRSAPTDPSVHESKKKKTPPPARSGGFRVCFSLN